MKRFNFRSGRAARMAAMAILIAALSSTARADTLVDSGTGTLVNGNFAPVPTGNVQYAVYANDAPGINNVFAGIPGTVGTPTLASATDSGAIVTDAAFLYLYEVRLPALATDFIHELQVTGLTSAFTSYGYIAGTVFDSATTYGAASGSGDTLHLAQLSTAPLFVNPLGPNDVTLGLNTGLAPGGLTNTVLLFITSDRGPATFLSGLHDGDTSYAPLPAPSPVPATLALLLSGVPGFAGIGMMIRRKQKLAA